jgi:succinylarginine dihydrolase
MKAYEVNLDGLVGPTHNYAGLAYGNVAAMEHRLTVSNPRAAVLQGLEKMKLLADLGLKQAILPPHERPDFTTLRALGFRGADADVLAQAAGHAPHLLASCYSSSSMWTANAGTVSPSADAQDGRVHFTPANLVTHLHRFIEHEFTGNLLKLIFSDDRVFAHHAALPSSCQLSDEGAANHTRLCMNYGKPGIELFAYGRRSFHDSDQGPATYPARQTLEASKAIVRLHRLQPERTVFVRQNPQAINAGVFHNDVISMGNENLFLYHSLAFTDSDAVLEKLRCKFAAHCHGELLALEVTPDRLSLEDAVRTYFFNSQLVSLPQGGMCLVAPAECAENPSTLSYLEELESGHGPVSKVIFADVRQSMKNGGGPACLRLRVVLTDEEFGLMHQGVYLTDDLYEHLRQWAECHYRDRLHPHDFVDPKLVAETRCALDELTQLLQLGPIYDFQMA